MPAKERTSIEPAHAPFSLSLPAKALSDYVARQINTFFPDTDETQSVAKLLPDALDRVEHCLRHVRFKGYWSPEGPHFNHLHTDQYAVFLYYLANSAYLRGIATLAAKAYALNKALHGFDAFYEVELPAIFAVVHPVGTVLGRASYADYFIAYQNVGVGADPFTFERPSFGEGVVMYGGSRVLGPAKIGSNCLISAGASLIGITVPDNHVAFSLFPNISAKPTRHHVKRDIFKIGS
jgi:serine O-acetyltransferase